MSLLIAYKPIDITAPQMSVEAINRNFGPVNLYSFEYDEFWAGTGSIDEELTYVYEGYGFRLGTTSGYLTRMGGYLDNKPHFSLDGFNVSIDEMVNFTPGQPISQLGIFMEADEMYGSDGNDFLKGYGGPDEIWGNDGNDTINGGAGGDEINGKDGNDLLIGSRGSDWLQGEPGNDTIKAGSGADYIWGGNGSDVLIGGGGANVFRAGYDSDVDTITVLTDGNFLGRVDHSKYDILEDLNSNDRIIMDVDGPATLEFTSFGNGEIDIWVDNELEAIVHGLSLSQVEDMTSLG
tara:strand:+ start:49 stop:924 length:876 start_codon:yes stop_codon:yes gene_type:complete